MNAFMAPHRSPPPAPALIDSLNSSLSDYIDLQSPDLFAKKARLVDFVHTAGAEVGDDLVWSEACAGL